MIPFFYDLARDMQDPQVFGGVTGGLVHGILLSEFFMTRRFSCSISTFLTLTVLLSVSPSLGCAQDPQTESD
ncbi:MAG: hypothetical protein R3301_20015, partial [Saprospiraceae bacterium]|nr:hypothetical protein [Saprospiraceae bacterium]